ncbi:GIY-YIG nuclease family protein [Umezakia ovalisporum]|uniref:GIY-YIG nuclease family protein n=2 Tax=Umezakia ovalisporum TaxID=75695 RepID=A0ABT6K705_9CYAN|nr:GIY-YIG nuclease family protein [Umezakia ovalisporum]MDH6058168.1 GIY-YIG nuclease family protein [Umezakia ovalisporum FSS-43]MDH6069169.1 GIY-YIG nuclease family protein [Umezakia ovalisporum APH033B]MDH6071730.1 GIY-YIG nuclease family protein [Umezakia ovalisporum CobakiLakeA]MDH6074243.1 GIY-YIG nuclease family protein [Umezakia ovalisporum CS-1034]MDH6095519.1 GIY-YIG nuclease family protein [Umezakia ovalisporum CobakiLakeB]
MKITIKKLAKVMLGEYHNLPDSPGIYFICDDAYRVWYVGISTSSLRQRHQNHERTADFKSNGCQWICYLNWDSVEDLHDWEYQNIQKFQPPLNKNLTEPELPLIDLGYDESEYFKRYQEIKQIQANLDQELEELKPNLVTLIEKHGGKIKTSNLSAFLVKRNTWDYSEEVEALNSQLKLKKKEEENTGIATVKSVTIYPVVRSVG